MAKKYAGVHGRIWKKESAITTSGGNHDKTLPENLQHIQHHRALPSLDSDEILKTAVEMDRRSLDEEISHGSKSTSTTNSISPYRRSVSPDTMLQGVTPNTSTSVSFFCLIKVFPKCIIFFW